MARELTIQIRLTKEEHSAIATQAGREGLGVGTYLRSLALRESLQADRSGRGRAYRALRRSQDRSKTQGLVKLSAKTIRAEIAAARSRRRRS
jgi:hypothetical protein